MCRRMENGGPLFRRAPAYGYRLTDAGPHPNPAKAADGKRLHALAIDDYAATVVQRIYAEFLAGFGIYAIAERGLLFCGVCDRRMQGH
jgi:hypothetical protein